MHNAASVEVRPDTADHAAAVEASYEAALDAAPGMEDSDDSESSATISDAAAISSEPGDKLKAAAEDHHVAIDANGVTSAGGGSSATISAARTSEATQDHVADAAGMPPGGQPNNGEMEMWQLNAVLRTVSPCERAYLLDAVRTQMRGGHTWESALELVISTWLTFPPEGRPSL